MKLEQNEKPLLFSSTMIPDIFFSDHLSELPGDYLKIYLYIIFLSKYGKDIKLTDLSKKINIPLKTINDGMKFLEEHHLITKKKTGYIIISEKTIWRKVKWQEQTKEQRGFLMWFWL